MLSALTLTVEETGNLAQKLLEQVRESESPQKSFSRGRATPMLQCPVVRAVMAMKLENILVHLPYQLRDRTTQELFADRSTETLTCLQKAAEKAELFDTLPLFFIPNFSSSLLSCHGTGDLLVASIAQCPDIPESTPAQIQSAISALSQDPLPLNLAELRPKLGALLGNRGNEIQSADLAGPLFFVGVAAIVGLFCCFAGRKSKYN